MNFTRLVLRNIERRPFRNWVVFLCSALVAFLTVSTTVVVGGARDSLSLVVDRLGADIIVVPAGAEDRLENAFLMGSLEKIWMSDQVLEAVAQVPGVAAVSPQVYLETLVGATCCAVPEMFMLAYDPATDFTLKPWLDRNLDDGLAVGEAIGGSYVFVPEGADDILIYGYGVKLAANLEATGTGLDQSMFFTMATAEDIARVSIERATQPLEIPSDAISSVMVKVDPTYNAHDVAVELKRLVTGVVAVESSNLFATHRARIAGLSQTLLALIGIAWGLSVVLVGLLFSMVVNERKREIGVLRALGADRLTVLVSLLFEGLVLSLFGGMAGNGLSLLAITTLRGNLMDWLGFPFLLPTSAEAFPLVLLGLGVAAVTVFIAIILPTTRISTMDPVVAMRA